MLAAALLLATNSSTVVLSRGVALPGQPYSYWSVEDTTLDSSYADQNLGGHAYLNGGPGKVILIRFSDLRRALGPRQKIVWAKLELTSTSRELPRLSSASSVLASWNEGPAMVVSFKAPSSDAKTASPLSATFKHRRAGSDPIGWQGPGCSGIGDATLIPNAKGSQASPGIYEISGLEKAVQRTYDDPFETGGIALRFESACEFFSSQAPDGRPRLIVETASDVEPETDLSATLISRSPWPEIGAVNGPREVEQDGRKISIFPNPSAGPWPKEGEPITYSAQIKNVGQREVVGFSCRWRVRENWGGWAEYRRRLAPGESTSITFQKPFKGSPTDHRESWIAFEVKSDVDQNPANNGIETPETGLDLTALLGADQLDAPISFRGSRSKEDTAQSIVDQLNRVVLPYSRFSFAPDGARARFFINSHREGEAMVDANGTRIPIASSGYFVARGGLLNSFEFILKSTGLVPVASPDSIASIATPSGIFVVRGVKSLAPSMFGGGDTRFDGGLPSFMVLPPEPVSNPLLDNIVLEASGMLAMTDVWGLESRIGSRSNSVVPHLYRQPALALFSAQAMDGRPLASAKIRVYPVVADSINPPSPLYETTTDARGGFSLKDRPLPAVFPNLRPNPFGAIDALQPGRGLILELEYLGQRAMASISPWQLADMGARSGMNPVVFDIRFDVSDGPIGTTNLAKGRLATDSVKGLPAALAALVDDNDATIYSAPEKEGAWIEIDLGRDRAVAEVAMTISGREFWNDFEIVGYNTGQIATDASLWRRDKRLDWTMENRGAIEQGTVTVRYRAPARQFRYLRIRDRGRTPSPGKLAEIRVFGGSTGS